MARGRPRKVRKSLSSSKETKPKEPDLDLEEGSSRSRLEIRPIEFSDVESESERNEGIQEFIKENQRVAEMIVEGSTGVVSPILKAASQETKRSTEEAIKITLEDVEDEIHYWSSAMVCYVLGANPPVSVIDGFFRRIWKDKVDSVGSPKYGIFVVRFHDAETRDSIMKGGFIFFNRRPVIMKAWDQHMDIQKNKVCSVLIWIQLENLDLKFWVIEW